MGNTELAAFFLRGKFPYRDAGAWAAALVTEGFLVLTPQDGNGVKTFGLFERLGSCCSRTAASRVCRNKPDGARAPGAAAPARAHLQAPRRAGRTGLAFFGDAITPETFLPRRAEAAPSLILPSLTDATAASPAHTQHGGKLRFWRNQELKLHPEPVGQAINSTECPIG